MEMSESLTSTLFGRDAEPRRQLGYTAVGLAVVTTALLVGARSVGETGAAVGGFVLLGLMTLALVVGAYHAYRNAGLLWSLAPMAGLIVGIGVARVVSGVVAEPVPRQGLGTVDVAVILLGIGAVTVTGAYVVGLGWRG